MMGVFGPFFAHPLQRLYPGSMLRARHLLVVLPALLLLTGCMVQNNREKLVHSLRKFNAAMRWGAVDWAEEHVDPGKRRELLAHRKEFGGTLKVTDCEVGMVKLKGKSQAVAMVRIDWYLINSLRLQTSFVEQKWMLKRGKWLITSQRLVRGAPYPMLIRSPDRRKFQREETWPEV